MTAGDQFAGDLKPDRNAVEGIIVDKVGGPIDRVHDPGGRGVAAWWCLCLAVFLSEETVKSHVRHLLAKLQARSRAHAVAVGFRRGLIG